MRELIVVDIETTGLHKDSVILEVAAVSVRTKEELWFVPCIPEDALTRAEPEALQINRYYERGVFKHTLGSNGTDIQYNRLAFLLRDNTFGGSNPTFDSQRLTWKIGTVWHHRLADLSAFAAGKLGISPTELPGLEAVCKLLGVLNEEPHGALGDARATAECFRKLMG